MGSSERRLKLINEISSFLQGCPSCFKRDEWEEYVAAVVLAPPNVAPMAGAYCEHCEPWYQKLMHSAKLCAHPETTFKLVDRSWVGTRKVGLE
jgi:hypothetical protein